MSKILGIDLGTTNSCMAIMEGGEPVVIPNAEGQRTTPSIVAFAKNGERLVGQAAKRQAVTNPEHTIYSIKRFMGQKFDDTAGELANIPYDVIKGSTGDCAVKVGDKEYSAPELSSMILQKMKADAEAYLGEDVTEAVITVPAYFNDSQRQATKDAGRIAGLEVRRIINEPTAASLAYGLDKKDDQKIAVYDLGGGTFDVSVLDIGEGVFEVLATNGDTHLGGDDFDQTVIDWLVDEFKTESGVDLTGDNMALQRLKEAAEKAKCELSSSQSTDVNLPFITADASGPKHLNVTLSRAKLEQLVGDLVERSRGPVVSCMSDSGLSAVDEAILVGGSTRMPMVQELAKDVFGREPSKGVNPDEVVAVGAAIQGGIIMGDVKNVVLLDVTPLTLGIETQGGILTPLIERNTTIPTTRSQIFSTAADSQPSVEIKVFQGERKMANDNKNIGDFHLDEIPPAPRGVPQVEVTFDIDTDGILKVSALDKGTGKKQHITITASSGMSENEIERMVADAEKHAVEDEKRRDGVELRNQAESAAHQAEKVLKDNEEKISEETKTSLTGLVEGVREALKSDDGDQIKAAMEALTTAMQAAGEEIYAQADDADGAPAPDAEAPAGDEAKTEAKEDEADVIDADFEMVDDEAK